MINVVGKVMSTHSQDNVRYYSAHSPSCEDTFNGSVKDTFERLISSNVSHINEIISGRFKRMKDNSKVQASLHLALYWAAFAACSSESFEKTHARFMSLIRRTCKEKDLDEPLHLYVELCRLHDISKQITI